MRNRRTKFELIFVFVLFFLFIIFWSIVIIYYYELENWGLWITYFFMINSSIIVLWKSIAKWIRDFDDDKKIKIGKKFDFSFFICLFLSTFFFSFIMIKFSLIFLIFMSILFSLSVISAIYFGWFHYSEEIYEPYSKSSYISKPYMTQKQYIIFLTVYWSSFLFLFFYFLLC